jgi:hypothetical protein
MDGGNRYFKKKIIFTQKSPWWHHLDFGGSMKMMQHDITMVVAN